MSFNQKLRQVVYGDTRATQTNPLLQLPAGVTGMTWRGTGFENPPQEAVDLDPQTLPWELQADAETAPSVRVIEPTAAPTHPYISLALIGGILAVGAVILYAI